MSRPSPPSGPNAPPPGSFPEESGSSLAEEGEGSAPPEFLEAAGHLFVTLDLPEIPGHELAHYLGTNLLVLWRKGEPEEQARLIRLPRDVLPERAVLRVNNGVLDLEVPLAYTRHVSSQTGPDRSRGDTGPDRSRGDTDPDRSGGENGPTDGSA